MPSIVYLISGANRGIGLGLVTALAARDNTIVFAGARDPSSATELDKLVEKYPGKVHIVKLTACDKEENEAAVAKIREVAGRLDVVIANAGIAQYFGSALETPPEQMRIHFEVNTIGTLMLFQATYPLLHASTPTPKFIPITSGAGSITDCVKIPLAVTAYGASKAAQNYVARKLHVEHEDLICFPLNPGGVDTDLSTFAAASDPMMTIVKLKSVEETAKYLLHEIDTATRENKGGTFVNFDGARRDW